jgi:hypothetical protein
MRNSDQLLDKDKTIMNGSSFDECCLATRNDQLRP